MANFVASDLPITLCASAWDWVTGFVFHQLNFQIVLCSTVGSRPSPTTFIDQNSAG
jgi:hypothetical protein